MIICTSIGLSSLTGFADSKPTGHNVLYLEVFVGMEENGKGSKAEFDPLNKEIYATETIRWYNPTPGALIPHTVTFISNQSSPLLKSKIMETAMKINSSNAQTLNTSLAKLHNNSMAETSYGNDSYADFDSRSVLFPSAINSSDLNLPDNHISYLDPNGHRIFNGAIYNVTNDIGYLNSGLIWSEGVNTYTFPKVNSFIVTFMKPGVYHYLCLIHPEIKGTITVKPFSNIFITKLK